MRDIVLLTAGCSWTKGIGVGYEHGMSQADSIDVNGIFWNNEVCDNLSFRGILSKKYGIKNINLSKGGASNQQQFRLLKQFLSSSHYTQLVDTGTKIIALHGITSTARNEVYLNRAGKMQNLMYNYYAEDFQNEIDFMIKYFYDHDNEVERLTDEMNFMNRFYQAVGIDNLWFDTFNHHSYSNAIDNLIETNVAYRDLLSTMAAESGLVDMDTGYHKSIWEVDSNRVQWLIDRGLLNPFTHHPTKQGHEMIANIIDPYLEKII